MFKNIILILLCFLVSCSNPTSPEKQEDNNQNIIPPATEEELRIYGVDISQNDDVIMNKIETNLKSYFKEKQKPRILRILLFLF